MSSRKFFFSAIALFLSALLILSTITFIVDPFYYYRMGETKYLLNSRFVGAGLIKNYSYDTVMVGSSMIQNFNMASFRTKLDQNPLKATTSGIPLIDICTMLENVNQIGSAKNYYIGCDQYLFSKGQDNTDSQIPYYLYDNTVLNDYRYLLGYESFIKYLPVDILISLAYTIGINLPEKFDFETDVDFLETWYYSYSYGKEILKQQYESKIMATSTTAFEDLEAMKLKFEKMFNCLEVEDDKNYTLFFPPYSVLYWAQLRDDGINTYNAYFDFKEYVYNYCKSYNNIKVYDFQITPEICNLDLYRDFTHYNESVNELMIDCFVSGEYIMTEQSAKKNKTKMDLLINEFVVENSDWYGNT